ncbi:hypothetical protein ACOMHN_047003 [Nucella lapillus]
MSQTAGKPGAKSAASSVTAPYSKGQTSSSQHTDTTHRTPQCSLVTFTAKLTARAIPGRHQSAASSVTAPYSKGQTSSSQHTDTTHRTPQCSLVTFTAQLTARAIPGRHQVNTSHSDVHLLPNHPLNH